MPNTLASVATFTAPELVALRPPLGSPSEQAAFWLQRDIVRGVFAPLERLKVDHLAKFYDIGHSPVREAILLSSSSGLVAHEHQKGHRVAPVSSADYADLIDSYQSIYQVALTKAVERGDQAWEERVVVVLHRTLKVRKAAPDDDPQARELWQMAYKALHRELLSGCGSPVLIKVFLDLGNRLERYINLFGDFGLDRERDHHAEHRAIVDALVERDLGRLRGLIDEYFAHTQPIRDSILQKLRAKETGKSPRKEAA